MCDRPFLRAKRVRFGNHTFSHIFAHSPFQKSNCAIFLKCKKARFQNSHFFAHLCTFSHFKRAIMRSHFFVALWKSANVRSHFLLFFENVRMCDRTFYRSWKMWECAIAHFLLFKNVRSHIFRSLKMCDHTFTLSKKANVQKCAKNVRIVLFSHK